MKIDSGVVKSDGTFSEIKNVEFRDVQTSVLSCLSFFFRLSGIEIRLDSLLDIAPIPKSGLCERFFSYICKRTGIRAEKITMQNDYDFRRGILLARTAGHYYFLIISRNNATCTVILPGLAQPLVVLQSDSQLISDVRILYSLGFLKSAPSLLSFERNFKFWLIPNKISYYGTYEQQKLNDFVKLAQFAKNERLPEKILCMSIEGLRASHRSMTDQLNELYGNFRVVNLKRRCVFVDFEKIEEALIILINAANNIKPKSSSEIVSVVSKLMIDFLTIHPFINGNRRMSICVVNFYLEKFSYKILWENITISQLYYAIRVGARGHFSVINHMFSKNIQRLECHS